MPPLCQAPRSCVRHRLRQRLETGREVAGEQFSKPFHAEFFHAAFGLAGNQFRIRGETRFDGLPFIGGQLVPYAEERNGNRIFQSDDLIAPCGVEAFFKRKRMIRRDPAIAVHTGR